MKIEILIINKVLEKKAIEKANELNTKLFLMLPAKETNNSLFGLGDIEKTVIICNIKEDYLSLYKKFLIEDLKFDKKNTGIMISLGGDDMESKYDLIAVVITAGHMETIIEELRQLGSKGATILDGRGTGTNFSSFFGNNVTSEKEIVLSVVEKKLTQKIVESLNTKINADNQPSGIIFTMPVTNFVGLNTNKK